MIASSSDDIVRETAKTYMFGMINLAFIAMGMYSIWRPSFDLAQTMRWVIPGVTLAALGYGAERLQPVFARPAAWRILDISVALLMWVIAAALIIA